MAVKEARWAMDQDAKFLGGPDTTSLISEASLRRGFSGGKFHRLAVSFQEAIV